MTAREEALDAVSEAAARYEHAQHSQSAAREQFIDAIMDAAAANATQEEIADRCITFGKRLSRQRVAQLMKERRPSKDAEQSE